MAFSSIIRSDSTAVQNTFFTVNVSCSSQRNGTWQAVGILLLLLLNLYSFFQRWLKQALEEEGSTSPARRPSLFMPCEGPLSPSINGDSDSPLPYNGTCSLPGSVFVQR